MARRGGRLISIGAITLGLALWSVQPAAVVPVTTTTTQLTTNPAPQLDTEISGAFVVWTDQRNANDDVYACNVANCAATEFAVTSDSVNERLTAISGNIVVYTRIVGPNRTIQAFDIATMTPLGQIGSADVVQNPSVDGNLVAFEYGPASASQVGFVNLTTHAETIFPRVGTSVTVNPNVNAGRIAYETHATTASPGDLFIYDVATGVTTAIETDAIDARRPDVDGDLVVFDVSQTFGGTDTDIYIHRLSTGVTTRLALPGNQRFPHVSGDVIPFDDDSSGSPDIVLYHLPTGTFQVVAGGANAEFLNHIDGNRIVYTANTAGNNDVWMCTFQVQLPEIDVSPTAHDFGDVPVGTPASTVVTVSNVGSQPLHISNVALAPGGGAGFALTAPVPATTVQPGGTVDVSLTFTPPGTGVAGATLQIMSDDLDEPTVAVALTGAGVSIAPPPLAQIEALLAFFDQSVGNGTLAGNGPGNSAAGRLNALRNKIEAASDLIRDGMGAAACEQLLDAYRRVDGVAQPPDFAAGVARTELARRIQELRASLGCL